MVKSKSSILGIAAAASLAAASFVYAENPAPVVDINDNVQLAANTNAQQPAKVTDVSDNDASADDSDSASNSSASTQPAAVATPSVAMDSSMPVGQRLTGLARQVQNITAMNLPQQISDLQNQIQQLRGQLQVQSHDLKLLNTQQRSFYQDVDQRIQRLKALVSNSNGNGDDSSSNGSGPSPSGSSSNSNNSSKAAGSNVTSQLNTSTASQNFNLKDAQTYQSAFALVLKRKFTPAMEGFQNYLSSYPNGRYAVNAHYWLGEIYLRQSQTDKAVSEFATVVKNYPKSNKVADSKLKIAMIHMSQGKTAMAKNEYTALKKQYPGTTAAQLASIQLQQIAAGKETSHVQ
ncbi:MAG: tol-pal system protein YbgF [Coxiellaceae bacterium]|nr:tol-pal system protein YbgF [Coxiellaceae bacterium]